MRSRQCRQREYRSLVKYRKVVLGRLNRVQNNIRAIFSARGMGMTSGQTTQDSQTDIRIAPAVICMARSMVAILPLEPSVPRDITMPNA